MRRRLVDGEKDVSSGRGVRLAPGAAADRAGTSLAGGFRYLRRYSVRLRRAFYNRRVPQFMSRVKCGARQAT